MGKRLGFGAREALGSRQPLTPELQPDRQPDLQPEPEPDDHIETDGPADLE
jgi:hypothetical protein